MTWFVVGGLLWAACLIIIVYLRYRFDSANEVDFLEKHYEEIE